MAEWRPQVGKMVVVCLGLRFTVQNFDQLYVLVSSALPTILHSITVTKVLDII